MTERDNPFYDNHVFNELDLKRIKIKFWQYPFLWLKKTYVQIGEGQVYFFKRDCQGRYYLIKVEPLLESKPATK